MEIKTLFKGEDFLTSEMANILGGYNQDEVEINCNHNGVVQLPPNGNQVTLSVF